MSAGLLVILAFAIGLMCGLRSLTGPAVVAWAVHWRWIDLHGTWLSFLESTIVLVIATIAALVELIVDKLPSTPSRTQAPGLIARILLGGLCGAALCASGNKSVVLCSVIGAIGGIAGAFGGYQLRSRLVRSLRVPDLPIALVEDAIAIGGSLLIVSRFS